MSDYWSQLSSCDNKYQSLLMLESSNISMLRGQITHARVNSLFHMKSRIFLHARGSSKLIILNEK